MAGNRLCHISDLLGRSRVPKSEHGIGDAGDRVRAKYLGHGRLPLSNQIPVDRFKLVRAIIALDLIKKGTSRCSKVKTNLRNVPF